MNGSRRIRGLLLAVLTAGLRAGEAPAEDTLAAVKRDYEVIKGTQSSLERQRLDLPATGPSAPAPAAGETAVMSDLNPPLSPTRSVSRPGKSANWLLDAMAEKKTEPLNDLGSALSPDGNGPENPLASMQDLGGADQKPPSLAGKPGAAAENPLTAYLSSWMTPHDLELLKDKSAEAIAPVVPNQPPAGMRLPAAGGPGADPRANPYLMDPAPGLMEGPKDLLPAPFPTLAVPAPPGDLAPLKNQPPPGDSFKLPDDSKYFPQLKRF